VVSGLYILLKILVLSGSTRKHAKHTIKRKINLCVCVCVRVRVCVHDRTVSKAGDIGVEVVVVQCVFIRISGERRLFVLR